MDPFLYPEGSEIEYEKDLNPAQLEAVTTLEGPVLVIAGAGSGKTRTLTYRVARLVEEGVPPDSILLLTFTRRASQEMLDRAIKLLDTRCDRVAGGTFHSFAHQLLRRFAEKLGFTTRFSILDRGDSESLIELIKRDTLPKSLTGKGFPRKATMTSIFSAAANKGLEVEDVLREDYPHFLRVKEPLEELYFGFTQAKQTQNLMDFDDLLLHARALLSTDESVRAWVGRSFRYILVDEYQDTNKIQADILRHLASEHKNVMAVGDDCQSVYGFRGADFENIMRFPSEFPGTRVITLEQNYRSRQPVLDVTNKMVAQAERKYSKTLFTEIQGGDLPQLREFDSEQDQSDWITGEIKALEDQGVPLGEVAVLFRAGFHAFNLEVELTRSRIPFVKYGGFKFMESAHIKDVLVHMRVLSYPGDRLSWLRICQLLDHVGPKTAQNITDTVVAAGYKEVKPKKSWTPGWERLKVLLDEMDPEKKSVAQLGQEVLEYYAPVMRERFDNWPKRTKDLEQFVALMDKYGHDLDWFLSDMALEPPTASEDGNLAELAGEGRQKKDRLVLSTVHSAKGLEWDTVFIIWALDGRFPSMQAVHRQGQALEEELRLMYVAATRAKNRLVFCYPTNVFDPQAGTVLYRPSRFLDKIESDYLQRAF